MEIAGKLRIQIVEYILKKRGERGSLSFQKAALGVDIWNIEENYNVIFGGSKNVSAHKIYLRGQSSE